VWVTFGTAPGMVVEAPRPTGIATGCAGAMHFRCARLDTRLPQLFPDLIDNSIAADAFRLVRCWAG